MPRGLAENVGRIYRDFTRTTEDAHHDGGMVVPAPMEGCGREHRDAASQTAAEIGESI
jgi:hypothetical protein